MSVVGMTGFETNTEHADYDSLGSGAEIQGGTVRTGSYALKAVYDGTGPTGVKMVPLASGVDETTTRFYMNIETIPTTAHNGFGTWTVIWSADESSIVGVVSVGDDGKLYAEFNSTTFTSTNAFSTGQWYRVEVTYNRTGGSFDIKVDGVSWLSGTPPSGFVTSYVTVGGGQFLVFDNNTGAVIYFDDILWRDDGTFPGPGENHVFPIIADGNYTGWAASGGGADYADVDEAVPSKDTADYVSTSTDNLVESFKPDTAANLGINGPIQAVQSLVYKNSQTHDNLLRIDSSDNFSVGSGDYITRWLSQLRTSVIIVDDLTTDQWDTLEAGVRATEATEHRTYTVWVSVDYAPEIAGEKTHSCDFIAGSHAFQPDGAAGKDTYLLSTAATSNFGFSTAMSIGTTTGKTPATSRALLEFALSGVGAADTIRDVYLCLYVNSAGSSSTFKVAEMLRTTWEELQATWNVYKTGTNWQTAGCAGALDVDLATDYDNTASPPHTVGTFTYLLALKATEAGQAGGTAYLRVTNAEAEGSRGLYRSSSEASARTRPILVLQVDAAEGPAAAFIPRVIYC